MSDVRRYPVLYRFLNAAGEPIYIGSTWSPHLRWRKHEAALWFSEVASITVEHYTDIKAMREAEVAAILAEQPRYNLRDRKIGYANAYGHWSLLADAAPLPVGIERRWGRRQAVEPVEGD